MSRTLTVGYCDGAHYMIQYFKNHMSRALPGVNIVFRQDPPSNPDVLIYSIFGTLHHKYRCPKILISGEPNDMSAHRPQMLIDCKVTPHLQSPGARFAYLPFYVLSFIERFQNRAEDLIKGPANSPDKILASKPRFCAFLYSQNVDFRNHLYDLINSYKAVDALGKCRGRPGVQTDRATYEPGVRTYNDLAVQKYRPYKFVICCENSRHPGYVTEKIVSAMLAHAVPIYLGAPDIADHFNPESFVQVSSFDQALQRIRELDQDDSKYKEIVAKPWFRDNRLSKYFSPDYLVPALQPFLAQLSKSSSQSSSRQPQTKPHSVSKGVGRNRVVNGIRR